MKNEFSGSMEISYELLDGSKVTLNDVIDKSPISVNFTTTESLYEEDNVMTREDVLSQAQECVCGDREEDYGTPEDNFTIIADFWCTYLKVDRDAIDGKDVAAMMALVKIARIASGHAKSDNWVDIAGYAACGGEIESCMEG